MRKSIYLCLKCGLLNNFGRGLLICVVSHCEKGMLQYFSSIIYILLMQFSIRCG